MSGTTCAICLDDAKSPVAVPCGHIHCEKCLIQCIEACDNAVECPCPTCRAPFTIANPDLRFVPEKYHPFMSSSVRRVYPSPSDVVQTLEKRVKELRAEYGALKTKYRGVQASNEYLMLDKQRLMDRCEASQAAVANYREKERQLRDDMEVLSEERDAAEKDASDWEKKYKELKQKYSELKKSAARSEPESSPSHAAKRTSTQAALDASSNDDSTANSSIDRRPFAPIPKRLRLTGLNPGLESKFKTIKYVPAPPKPPKFRPYSSLSTKPEVFGAATGDRRAPSPDPELDDEEQDGPSKVRIQARLPSRSTLAVAVRFPGERTRDRDAGPSTRAPRASALQPPAAPPAAAAPKLKMSARRSEPAQARPRAPRSPWDVFGSDEGSHGSLDFTLGSSSPARAAHNDDDEQEDGEEGESSDDELLVQSTKGKARAYVFRGRRVMRPADA